MILTCAHRHEAKQELESYVSQVEHTLGSPDVGIKIKRGQRTAVETELAKAMERLEIEASTADELKKAQLTLKCVFSPFSCYDEGVADFDCNRRAMQKAVQSANR